MKTIIHRDVKVGSIIHHQTIKPILNRYGKIIEIDDCETSSVKIFWFRIFNIATNGISLNEKPFNDRYYFNDVVSRINRGIFKLINPIDSNLVCKKNK